MTQSLRQGLRVRSYLFILARARRWGEYLNTYTYLYAHRSYSSGAGRGVTSPRAQRRTQRASAQQKEGRGWGGGGGGRRQAAAAQRHRGARRQRRYRRYRRRRFPRRPRRYPAPPPPGGEGGDLIRSSRRFAPLHPQRRGKAALHPLSPHSALLVPLPIRRSLVFGGVRGERCSGGCGSGCGHGTEGWGGGDQQKVWGTPWGGSEVMEGVGRGLIPPSCCLRGGE